MPVIISYVETTVSEETFVSDDTIVGYKGELRFMDKNNYFLGSVGSVSAFRRNSSGELELAFVSTTNTDQGLNTSVSADDLRGGQGAPVITRFYHDVNVEITLTDIMFKEAYIAAQLGTHFESLGNAYYCEERDVNDSTGEVKLSKEVFGMLLLERITGFLQNRVKLPVRTLSLLIRPNSAKKITHKALRFVILPLESLVRLKQRFTRTSFLMSFSLSSQPLFLRAMLALLPMAALLAPSSLKSLVSV